MPGWGKALREQTIRLQELLAAAQALADERAATITFLKGLLRKGGASKPLTGSKHTTTEWRAGLPVRRSAAGRVSHVFRTAGSPQAERPSRPGSRCPSRPAPTPSIRRRRGT